MTARIRYHIMPYIQAQAAKAQPPEVPCSNHKRNLSLYQVLFDVVVKYDSYGHNRLELNHLSGYFSKICQDINQMNMKSFYFCTTEKKVAFLIGQGRLYGTLRYM